jgi:hypothetical protein
LDGADDGDSDRSALGEQQPEGVVDPPPEVAFVHIRQGGQLVDEDHNQRLGRGGLMQPGSPAQPQPPIATHPRRFLIEPVLNDPGYIVSSGADTRLRLAPSI